MFDLSVFEDVSIRGRKRIYTNEKHIDETNVLSVLNDALLIHSSNVTAIKSLLLFEKGEQPLVRNKVVRPEIDIAVVDNIANEVTEFKLAYNWGTPFEYVQRGKEDFHTSDEDTDDKAVSILNEMLQDSGMPYVNQEMARFVEIVGVGYKMIEMNKDYDKDVDTSIYNVTSLNPLYAFVIYENNAWRKPLMGVSFATNKDGSAYYTCITKDYIYEVGKKAKEEESKLELISHNNVVGYLNQYGMINIIEYNRSTDMMGCFERQVDEMNALNVQISDFSNNVAQQAQALWHANDCEFKTDDEGNVIKPKTGDWILTNSATSGTNQHPFIQSLASNFSSESTLASIINTRERILQKCDVPSRGDNAGGSTGSAMSMTSGWNDAELSASKEMMVIERSERNLLRVALKIARISSKLPVDSLLPTLKISDVKIKFPRNKSYDMATKANTFATYMAHGMHPRHALELIDIGGDIEQIYIDSKELFDKYQEQLFAEKTENDNTDSNATPDKKISSDKSDQYDQSPIAKI